MREQLIEASTATKKAINAYRREAEVDEHLNVAEGQTSTTEKNQDDNEMSVIITIMQPILRLMQLLCENHNRELQVRDYFKKMCIVNANLGDIHNEHTDAGQRKEKMQVLEICFKSWDPFNLSATFLELHVIHEML